MKIDSTTGFVILIASAILVIPITIAHNQEEVHSLQHFVLEDTVFDPLCKDLNENSTKIIQDMCHNQGESWYMELGTSANLEIDNDASSKILFIKIDATKIPQNNFFTQVTIDNAKLEIGTLYPSIKFTEDSNERFFVTYGGCSISSWSEMTTINELPCINEFNEPLLNIASYHGILNPERVTKQTFDLESHVNYFRSNEIYIFTELITFSAGSFTGDNELEREVQNCLKNSSTRSEKNNCLSTNEILIHSSEFTNTGFRPQLIIEYHLEPTIFMRSIYTVVFAVYPIIASVLFYQRGQENSFKAKMRRICDSLLKEIEDTVDGLKNGVNGNGCPKQDIVIDFNPNYTPITITLSQPMNDLLLFTEAYKGILNSGSFENFNKENQIAITKLYNDIFEYNKILEYFYKLVENARLETKSSAEMPDFIWGLKTNCEIYLTHLARLRDSIIQEIEGSGGVLKILQKEKDLEFQ